MKRIHHHLTLKQIQILQKISKETGLTVAELIRRAVDGYIEKIKKEENEKF
jgi:predicted DNA-binding protein